MSSEISPGFPFPSRMVEIRGTEPPLVVASVVSSPVVRETAIGSSAASLGSGTSVDRQWLSTPAE